jgi:hypothetical protein
MWTIGALLLVLAGCSGSATDSTPPRGSTARLPSAFASRQDSNGGTVRDARGTGLVRLSLSDNGVSVLVDGGQRLELTIDSAEAWVPPYLEGPRGQTGQDRVLYLQEATGFPAAGPAFARLLAANPGDVVIASHQAACASACAASMTFRVPVYVDTVPSS